VCRRLNGGYRGNRANNEQARGERRDSRDDMAELGKQQRALPERAPDALASACTSGSGTLSPAKGRAGHSPGLGSVVDVEGETAVLVDFRTHRMRMALPCAKLLKL
jgi:hypothetical protein